MFADLVHFQSLACTDAVAYSGDPDYTKIDGNGNVFCAYTKSTVTNKDRSAKDGEWPDYAATSTVTYDPFGDGTDKNAWADTFTSSTANPLWKMNGF